MNLGKRRLDTGGAGEITGRGHILIFHKIFKCIITSKMIF